MKKITLLWAVMLLAQFTFGRSLYHPSNFTFQHYPTVKNHQLAFTYSGRLARFDKTVIELLYYKDQHLHINEISLSSNKQGIKGQAVLPKDVSAFALSVFNERVGTDNNAGAGYVFCIYNNSKPVKGAVMNKSLLLTSGRVGVSKAVYQKALQLQHKEFSIHPQLKQKYILPHLKAFIKYSSKNYQLAERKLNEIFKDLIHSDASEGSLINIMRLYAAMHRQGSRDSVLQIIMNKYPHGVGAAMFELNTIKNYKNPDSMGVGLLHFKKKFNQLNFKEPVLAKLLSSVYNQIAFKYFQKKEYTKMLSYLSRVPLHLLKATYLVINYNRLVHLKAPMSDSFVRALSSQALEAITKAKNQRPDDQSPTTWKKLINDYYAPIIDIHARALAMSDDIEGAIKAEKGILPFNAGYTGNFNLHYLDYISRSGNDDMLLTEAQDIYVHNKPCPGIDSIIETAYHRSTGSSNEEYLIFREKLDSLSNLNKIKNLKEGMLHIETPLFTLKDLNGVDVSLQNLRGKVVILDFWATWCRPCIESFKGMKRLKDKYKDDKEVVFLFIDEDDPQPNEESRIKKIRDFLQEKNYRFRVLLDTKDKNSVQQKYFISGIPVKVVIDKKGIMQFKEIGYSGDLHKLVNQMDSMINILKEK
ncbi:MAG TPA: TlpA disulfide reductase family protein [Chitinophagaceae bacterium]|nr:TlpA disulfide reductase family protein [Chitinophagaceae bacterium]